MKSNKSIIILVFAVLLLVSSCDNVNKTLNCNVGVEGVSARFSSDTLREVYNEDVTYPIVIDLNNKGAYSTPVFLEISHNIDLIGVEPETLVTERIEGKAPWNECKGSLRKEVFNIKPKKLLAAVQEFRTEISINACYNYIVELNNTICVHNNIAEINILRDNCRYGDKNLGGGQGSPLSFVKAEAPIYIEDGNKVRIRFYLRNYKQGTIFSTTETNLSIACTQRNQTYPDFINIEGYLDEHELDCSILKDANSPEGYTKLLADTKYVTQNDVETVLKDYYIECEAEGVELNSPREMTINLKANYYYRELGIETKTINIRKV